MICETFGCLPDEAERQDWATVQAILDYRAAHRAIDLFNQGKEGIEQLQGQPALTDMIRLLGLADRDALTLAEAERQPRERDPLFALAAGAEED